MNKKYQIVIPHYTPPLLNQLLGAHWSKGAKLKQECANLVNVYARFCRVPQAVGKRRVSLAFVGWPRGRLPDPDAFWKATLDALVVCGMLRDDSQKWCEQGGTPTITRGHKRESIITLEDIN